MDHDSTATPDAAFRRLVESSPDAICVHDGEVVQYANPAAAAILGAVSPAEIIGQRIDGFIHVDSRRVLYDRIEDLLDGTPTTSTVLAQVVRPGGRVRTVEARSAPTTWDGGPAIMSSVRDLTGQSTAEESARVAERRLAEIVDSLVDGVVVQDRRGYVRSMNPAAARLLGVEADEAIGTDFPALLWERGLVRRTDGKMITPAELPHRRAQQTGEPASFDLEITRRDRTVVIIRGTTTLVGVDHTRLVISSFADVTADREAEARLRYQARHDSLTGLPNRQHVVEELAEAVRDPARDCDLGVLYLDLDALKAVNDTLGHSVGDDLLTRVSARLASVIPSGGVLGRVGGDEFVAVLRGSADDVEDVARALHGALRGTIGLEGRAVRITASIGAVAVPVDDHRSIDDVLRDADYAMYEAKGSGGDRTAWHRRPGRPD
ncbi:MAG: diguanylate cyclase [Williamsia herbipolensis]|uniref:PAS domain S-box-containing protein/diguanylate cyclase (GGDEF) domain-containing protein n=1 Tax=Williamsia serinedens TaxID=391736 RepID=A0ABT1H4X1_9NOCA|nr:diguanylate cyclase [Williamsia serinedens]MBE7160707.1 diguanylate cyclase [Williamsia herbipolensis]MCP2162287.1 PAS domain S-box-containing protein/diguanylate cyclase (GGDEF) domain-containing protein [Williamsia serinedens]